MDKKKQFIVNAAYYAIIIIILLVLAKFILPVMVPFIIGFIIAAILQVPIRKIHDNGSGVKRILSLLLLGIFFILLFAIAILSILKIFEGLNIFVEELPRLYQNDIVPVMDELFNKIETFVSKSDIIQMSTVEGIIQNMMNNTGEYITNFSMKAVKIISDSILGVPTFIIKLIITIVSSFFFMVDYDKVINFVNSYIPEDRKEFVQKLKYYGVSTLGAYAKSYILLFLLTFIELTIGFNLIGIPYATIIALTVAIFDILPVLGTGGILIPWSIIGFAISNFKIGIGMMVLYLIITAIRNTLEPKIIGTQIGLHPLATLISMYLGLHIFGIVGMFIFPITLAVFTSINKNKEQTKEKLLN